MDTGREELTQWTVFGVILPVWGRWVESLEWTVLVVTLTPLRGHGGGDWTLYGQASQTWCNMILHLSMHLMKALPVACSLSPLSAHHLISA